MARREKQHDAVERHEQNREVRWQQSRTVEKTFPNVLSIRLALTFEDIDEKTHPDPKELTYTANSRAFFELKCPYQECVMGGFNFTSAVRNAITERKDYSKGTEKCPGWQDRERIHKHGCHLTAHYVLRVEYASAV